MIIDENSIDNFQKFLDRFSSNNTKTSVIHFEIIKERFLIETDIGNLKHNVELKSAVQDALLYFVSVKIINGDKLKHSVKTYEQFDSEKEIVTKNSENGKGEKPSVINGKFSLESDKKREINRYYDSKTCDVSTKTGLTVEPRNEINTKNGSNSCAKRIDVGISLMQSSYSLISEVETLEFTEKDKRFLKTPGGKVHRIVRRLKSGNKFEKSPNKKSFLSNNVEIDFSSKYSKEFNLLKNVDLSVGMKIASSGGGVEQCIHPAIDSGSPMPKIEFKEFQVLKIKKASQINDINMLFAGLEVDRTLSKETREVTENFNLCNDSKMNAIHSEIIVEKAQCEYDINYLKPTVKLSQAIDEALESNIPIESLNRVFEKYGHVISTKILFGDKLRSSVKFNDDPHILYDDITQKFDKFSEIDVTSLNKFVCFEHMLDMNDEPVEISRIPQWLENVSKKSLDWRVIRRVVAPLYKILDIKQQQKIENLYKKEDRVLMNNETLLNNISKGYQRIVFDEPLKSNNFQIYGSIVTSDGEKLPEVVEFSLKSNFGFSVSWNEETVKAKYNRSFKLQWILIGCPSEIGYFDAKTRDISVKNGFTEVKLMPKAAENNKNYSRLWTIQIDIGTKLSRHNCNTSIVIEYDPRLNTNFFKSDYKISGSVIEVQITIDGDRNIEFIKRDKQYLAKIRWCVTFQGAQYRQDNSYKNPNNEDLLEEQHNQNQMSLSNLRAFHFPCLPK
ncbi:7475_t:CDS:2 [Ambispora gerdemannii]|uniref:7475_t:CDS:1 n=1 Tax=Ambispora gerdemannii TaxID=144530 RepID=A0A9N9G4V2_9GLOM|nr:7475_t:CDS:2 [Ambispora gerdemannii]